jgi:hypothetical protein
MTNLPQEFWYSIASVILTLVISAAHQRGHRLPLIEIILDAVHRQRGSQVTLDLIWEELRRRLPEQTSRDVKMDRERGSGATA